MRIRLRKSLAQAAMLVYLLTVSPVYAMSEIERLEINRPAIVQTISARPRHRLALERRNSYSSVTYRMAY